MGVLLFQYYFKILNTKGSFKRFHACLTFIQQMSKESQLTQKLDKVFKWFRHNNKLHSTLSLCIQVYTCITGYPHTVSENYNYLQNCSHTFNWRKTHSLTINNSLTNKATINFALHPLAPFNIVNHSFTHGSEFQQQRTAETGNLTFMNST